MPPRSHRPLKEKDNEIVVLRQVGKLSNVEIARCEGVTEGAIRYRLKHQAEGKEDGRKRKPSQLDGYREIIRGWIDDQSGRRHRETLKLLKGLLRGARRGPFPSRPPPTTAPVRPTHPLYHRPGEKERGGLNE